MLFNEQGFNVTSNDTNDTDNAINNENYEEVVELQESKLEQVSRDNVKSASVSALSRRQTAGEN